MKTILHALRAASALVLLAGPAFAQTPNINLMPELVSKTPEEKERDRQTEKAYKDSLRKIPEAQGSIDPWGSVRSAETPRAPKQKKAGSAAN